MRDKGKEARGEDTNVRDPTTYKLSDRAHLVLECADRGWLAHLNGLTNWSVNPGRGNGLRFVVTAATGQKLVHDGLLDLTSGGQCRVTKFGRDVLAPRRGAGWELDAGVGHKPRLHQPAGASEELPADKGPAVLRELLRLEG
ncbi:hypothetical protein ACIQVK_18715 [Streptomyces sp. NPDC090493]|uniref:hypothetical protein n=1 Tax=Streptomyces sp. NPDC090493 TaxID=3365964 RepID=UPI00381D0A9F